MQVGFVKGFTLSQRRLALGALMIAIVAGSTASILIRWSNAPTTTQVFYRLLFTTAAVAPISLLRHREAFQEIVRRDLIITAVTGVTLGAHFLLFFRSLDWTTVAAATTLSQTHTILIPIGAYLLLDERVTRRMVLGFGIALGGILLLSTGGLFFQTLFAGQRPLYGNGLAVTAAIGFAGYTLAGRSVRQRLSLFPYVTIVYGMATISVMGYAKLIEVPLFHPFPLAEWAIFLGLALGPGLLCHTLLNWSLKYVDASMGSAAFLGIPVLSTLLASILLDEIASPITIVSCGIVLLGIYFVTVGTSNDS